MYSRNTLNFCVLLAVIALGVDAASTWIRSDASGAANFRGWFIKGLTTSPKFCASGQTRTASGGFAGCCSTASCPLPTECRSDTLTFDGGSTRTCNRGATCWTMSVYATPPADGAFYNDLWCAGANTETELFLSIEVTSTGRATSTATNTSAAADSGSNSGSSSKAWIAGVVIGPLAGIALGVLVFFMLRRRWKKKHDATAAAAAAATAPGAENGGGHGMQEDWTKTQTPSGYSHQQWQSSPHPAPLELDTNRFAGPPREMGTANVTASELDAGQVPRR